ncbi:MAG: C1 family peptidase [Syntrophorhabdales bacterium]|jgi:C1A family cysteine protease
MTKIMRVCLCGLFMVMLAGSYVMANDELEYVKQAIAAKGGRWHAEENNVSRLSHEARRMKLGLNKAQMPNAPLLAAPAPSQVTALSATFDWRTYNGGGWVTPVRDQGQCGSCWAFATTANLESVTLIKNNTPGVNLDLAEQILVSCSGAGSCSGGSPGSASNYIKSTGLPVETCYPYTALNGTCSSACSGWQASDYKISGWSYVTTTAPTVDAIKNALNTYGPVNTTMEVYSDFFYYSSGVYHYATGTYEGGHAILIVGYDDVNQCFIVKNSWGTGWGEAGFFRIAYSELNSVTQFGDYTIAYQAGSTPPPPSCTYSLSSSSASYSAPGGKGTVSVTAGSGCTWTASSSVNWITITAGASGTGNGTVAYTVAANTSTSSRPGKLTIAGQTFMVSQSGAPTYIITATAGAHGTIAPIGTVSVVSGTNQTFKITPATGYKIASVLVDGYSIGAPSSVTFTNVTANHTISPSFAAVTYTLTVSKNGTGSGTVSSSPQGPTYNAGTYVSLSAAAGANATFAGWSGACSGRSSTCTVVMNGNASATATFNSTRGAR